MLRCADGFLSIERRLLQFGRHMRQAMWNCSRGSISIEKKLWLEDLVIMMAHGNTSTVSRVGH